MGNPELLTGLGVTVSIFLASAGVVFASIPDAAIFATRRSTSCMKAETFFRFMLGAVLTTYVSLVAVIFVVCLDGEEFETHRSYKHFSAGLAVGLACLTTGLGMATFLESYMNPNRFRPAVDDVGEREALLRSPREIAADLLGSFLKVFVFVEAIGLYGLIVAMFLVGKSAS